jgi:hypothetical protein
MLRKNAPNVKNLAFGNNNISGIAELDHLKGYSSTLQQLILVGNPLIRNADPYVYHHMIQQKFPRIKMLDQQQVVSMIKFNLPSLSSGNDVSLPSFQGNFTQSDEILQYITGFVNEYFNAYDNNRDILIDLYHREFAKFSLQLPDDMQFQHSLKAYSAVNRNLLSSSSSSSSISSSSNEGGTSRGGARTMRPTISQTMNLKVGFVNILFFLKTLPASKHDTNGFVVDAFAVPGLDGVVQLSIRGKFLETESNLLRYFHRTFLLCKAQNPLGLAILNDQFYVSSRESRYYPEQQQQQQQQQHSIDTGMANGNGQGGMLGHSNVAY